MASYEAGTTNGKMEHGGSYRRLQESADAADSHVIALDIGTTTLRCHVYDRELNVKGTDASQIELIRPEAGHVEMDPDRLWQQTQDVIKGAIKDCGLKITDLKTMGISTQRNTFITWHRETGKPYHRFITWQDLRASDDVKSWNESYTMKGFNTGSKVLHTVTRKKRFLSASVLRFKSAQIKKQAELGNVRFGTIDTWLLWKLTGGEAYATDYTNASSTGIFDPFNMEWSPIVCGLVGLPINIFPPIKDTSTFFGMCSPDLFGAPIAVTSLVADQQGAMFGQGCFKVGDVNLTLGTGTFIDCNTGSKPHASVAGLYPVIGWKIGSELVFVAEGMGSDTGRCIEWIKELGMFEKVSETSDIAESVSDSGGAYFIPAFSGLQTPLNDDKACAGLIGLKPSTSKAHIVRAVLESLAFRTKLLYDTVIEETKTSLQNTIRIDGGVCNNDFLMKLTADLLGVTLEKPQHLEMASLGAAFLAGLAIGVWKSKDELLKLRKASKVYHPDSKRHDQYKAVLAEWQRAAKRTYGWYKNVPT